MRLTNWTGSGLAALLVLAAGACPVGPWAHAQTNEHGASVSATSPPIAGAAIRVADDARTLERADGRTFFYLADTAWTAVTRLTLAEMDEYLADRAAKGFTVIQTILVPWDARWTGNLAGAKPFVDDDETRPDEAYWTHVDAWLTKIHAHGMLPAVVPFWLRGRNEDRGPVAGDTESLTAYARFVGERYRDLELLWLLGADAPGDAWTGHFARFADTLERASGRGAAASEGEAERAPWLMTHHPEGGGTSARLFHDTAWLDFHGLQSGHWLSGRHDALIDHAWRMRPAKPVIDLEPAYEHITDTLAEVRPGVKLVEDFDVRRQAYQAVFAGAAGHAYGCAEVYEFHTDKHGKARWTVGTHWREALQFPGAGQLQHLRTLMERLPMRGRVPDQSIIGAAPSEDMQQRRRAIRNTTGDRAYVYLPTGGDVVLSKEELHRLASHNTQETAGPESRFWRAMWFDPRTGSEVAIDASQAAELRDARLHVTSPTAGTGEDWILLLELLAGPSSPTPTPPSR